MSRKASENVEYTLRSLSSLMGERRRKQQEPDAASTAGERSLLAAAESSASLQGAGAGGGGGVGDLERAARRQFQQDETPAFVYVVAVFSALGGFLFGYDTGVVSGAMLLLKRQLSLDALWQELLVSGTVGAAAVSALAGGALNGVFGRRAAILLASALFTAGSAVLAAANNKETLLAGRLVVGLGIALWSPPSPRGPCRPRASESAVQLWQVLDIWVLCLVFYLIGKSSPCCVFKGPFQMSRTVRNIYASVRVAGQGSQRGLLIKRGYSYPKKEKPKLFQMENGMLISSILTVEIRKGLSRPNLEMSKERKP
ncbi:hypothetical protein FD754_002970 [Muntiacus muntjak]|uniref:Major facilitator superfamily (MFS) profile domain-containing protein n=1 Tax=Muntiacus muntjak TaxID=9888 RepID=A0A5N3WBF8_MUNMU|nr:hypothetical protein FD754_002970 [Muntiacus muntjak]